MPHLHRIKTAKGHTMVLAPDPAAIEEIAVVQPLSPTLGQQTGRVLYACQLCPDGKAFRSAGVAAIHFQKQHAEQNLDRDSWRTYFKQVSRGADAQ